MKKKILVLIIFIPWLTYSQQESKIKMDSANKNQVTVTQEGSDTSKKSEIDLSKSDSNNIHLKQVSVDSPKTNKGKDGFINIFSDTDNILKPIATAVVILGGIVSIYISLRKKKKK